MAQLATINPLNQFFALNGDPLNNGKLYFGDINADPEQNPVQMYWDAAGLVPALQPIRTTSGYPSRSGSPAILYCAVEYSLRVRQSNDVQVFYLPRAGSVGLQTFGQWQATTVTPSFVSTTSFTLTGDQTADFQPGRRARFAVTAGTVYGTISTSVYGALTTVTMIMDGASVLDAGLSSVDLSILTPQNPSVPTIYAKSGANADITSLTALANPQIRSRTYATYTANANLVTVMPTGSVPQITDGTLVLTAAVTTVSATDKVRIRFDGTVAVTTAPQLVIAAAFINATAAALRSKVIYATLIDLPFGIAFYHEFTPGTVGVQTITVRVGAQTNTVRMNGSTAALYGGGSQAATLTVEVVTA